MTLYLVAEEIPYEGCVKHWIFSTSEKAIAFLRKQESNYFSVFPIELDSEEGSSIVTWE